MNITPEQIEVGQAFYTKQTLSIYNFVVLDVSNRFLWECLTEHLLEQYNQWVTNNHLDVGVGTGYFLDQCQFGSPPHRIVLMELNSKVLEVTLANLHSSFFFNRVQISAICIVRIC